MDDYSPYVVGHTQSIHDRENLRPIVIKGQYIDFDWVLVALSFIIIFICLGWILFTIFNQPPKTENNNDQFCPVGQCATNFFNGVKTCPLTNQDNVIYDPTFQVCNDRSVCTSGSTPYAVQNDGDVSLDGICPVDSDCRCVARPQCGDQVLTVFQVRNGNPFSTLNGQRLIINQISSFDNGVGFSSEPPIQYDDPLSTFCAIPNSWVDRIGGVCQRGELAYLPTDPNNFDLAQANNAPLACVQGVPCTSPDQTQIWNSTVNQIGCVNLCPMNQKPVWNPNTNQLECHNL